MTRSVEDLERLRNAYQGEPVCPCCGNGLPVCSDHPFTHQSTCEVYRWSEDLCANCTADIGGAI